MAGRIDARLRQLGITLAAAPPPAANYVPFVVSGALVFIAGQVPFDGKGLPYRGKLGGGVSIEEGQAAARLCALNILAQLKAACGGDLDRVRACVKLGGFVNATPDFPDHPKVMNGASDLMVEVFGEAGRHARFAVGAPSLPFDVAVEVDAVFEIGPG
ncbi:MAG: RidA family protein [Alphaproteobacteria bacterium]|nr:RidA family protein [Alphaproteobacteria bacterium]